VKIRGTPAHIAEKYMTLARDATSSGDPVLAENYLQHAEHYNRIIMAFRDQHMAQGGEAMNGAMSRNRSSFMGHEGMEPGDEFSDDDGDDGDAQPPMRQHEPQPRIDAQRVEGQRGGHEQHRFRDRSDRQGRHGGEQRGYQSPRQHNPEAGAEGVSHQPPGPEGQTRRRDSFAQTHEQPEFLRRPVRRPRREGNGTPSETNGVAEETEQD
jgi:hypothetical protein